MSSIWRAATPTLLLKLFEQGWLGPDTDMRFSPYAALALGFWHEDWNEYDSWPWGTHRYLLTAGSESYLSILDDKRNLIKLIKRFLM